MSVGSIGTFEARGFDAAGDSEPGGPSVATLGADEGVAAGVAVVLAEAAGDAAIAA
jgi:hypothetical protein